MKKLMLFLFFMALTLTACVVAPGPPGYEGAVIVPPLPSIVVLGTDPYYYQNGYYYYYRNNNWSYSQSRSGPWRELPRSHWPKEIRHRERDRDDRGRDFDRDRDRDRDRGRDHDRDGEEHDRR